MKTNLSAAAVLAALLAASPALAGQITVDGSTTVGPLVKALAETFRTANTETEITVSESGSGNGAKSLVNGLCHIAMLSRPLKSTEFKAAVERNIEPTPHVLAYDAIVLIVHPSNPVKGLTREQARDIFSGKITNWRAVGGADAAIIVISRDSNSGTFETFEQLVMNKELISAKTETAGSNGAVRQRVQNTPNALGYVGIGYVDRTTKALAIDGTAPSAETVKEGLYALSRPLFVYTNGYPALGSELHRFISFYLSKRGQSIIEEVGFVPVTQY
ncbi:MAG: PstS family phosphate ABC transporter substrate-binding protein [Verrucomicrobiota bacterium]|jgi:phosphate transport system substrate-binding protein|nr:PstS family phosphate ABC transporter substrate-binding protein [Verrucomicrobiota bacterium]